MSPEIWLWVAVRSALVFTGMFAVHSLLFRAPARQRRRLLLLGFATALLLPIGLLIPSHQRLAVEQDLGVFRLVSEVMPFSPPNASKPPQLQLGHLPETHTNWLGVLLVGAWALGFLVFALRLTVGTLAARRLLCRARTDELGLRYSAEVATPMVVGVFRPLIILPAASGAWEAERLRAALVHERAHVKQHDGLALALARWCAALYWFQPLAWLCLRRLRYECEVLADEAVVDAGLLPSQYAGYLLGLACQFVEIPGTIAMATRTSQLEQRINSLLRARTTQSSISRGIAVGLTLLFGASSACLAAVSFKDEQSASKPVQGGDARITSIAQNLARQLRFEWSATRVALVIVSAKDGSLLGYIDDQPGQAIVPASTLKPLVAAVALDQGVVSTTERFDCGNGKRAYPDYTLKDYTAFGDLTVGEILAVSSNIGASRIFDRLSPEAFRSGLSRFGIQVPEAGPGTFRGATVGMGQRGVTTTPVELARAYAALANGGVSYATDPANGVRAVRAETARAVLEMLENAVSGERSTGRGAQMPGLRIAGKTGTSDAEHVLASFVGIVPATAPEYVVYVGVQDPAGSGSGASVAAPAFARLATQLMSH